MRQGYPGVRPSAIWRRAPSFASSASESANRWLNCAAGRPQMRKSDKCGLKAIPPSCASRKGAGVNQASTPQVEALTGRILSRDRGNRPPDLRPEYLTEWSDNPFQL